MMRYIPIQISASVVNFDVLPSNRGCTAFDVQFNNLTTSPLPIASLQWTFGPTGATSTDENPVFTYQNPGFYTVSLIAVDSLGCTDTLTRNNYISVFQAIPQFTADEPIVNVTDFIWDLGNGVLDSGASIVYTKFKDMLQGMPN